MIHLIVAAVVCGLDQALKYWTQMNIAKTGEVINLIPGILTLRFQKNTGAALSMFAEHTWILTGVSVAASIFILILILKKGFTFREKLALGMVLGGAVGNAIDRIMLQYVVDMLEMDFLPIFVFNVADAFIDIGGVLFCIFYFLRINEEDKKFKQGMPELQRLKNASAENAAAVTDAPDAESAAEADENADDGASGEKPDAEADDEG